MDMTDSIANLAAALATVQASIEGAEKDRSNPAFKSKYATLASVWEAWQAVGPKQGLSLVQLPGAMTDGKVTLTTMMLHKSGEWMRETLTIPVTKPDAQGYGSALTYARRYALAAFAGIAPEDDDGNGCVSRDPPKPQSTEPPQGWSAWALEFAAVIDRCETTDAIDRHQLTHKANLAAVKAAAPAIYASIGKAITARKAVTSPATQKATKP